MTARPAQPPKYDIRLFQPPISFLSKVAVLFVPMKPAEHMHEISCTNERTLAFVYLGFNEKGEPSSAGRFAWIVCLPYDKLVAWDAFQYRLVYSSAIYYQRWHLHAALPLPPLSRDLPIANLCLSDVSKIARPFLNEVKRKVLYASMGKV